MSSRRRQKRPKRTPPLSDEELEAQALAAEAAEEAAVVVPAPEDEAPLEALAQEQEKPTKEGFFARLKRSLLKTKQKSRFRIYQPVPR
ncbi:signal recognition particle-docking protein FtsY [Klebsiella pneumoniae]|nr:signal recognition particle-docking protein FtsY [Klebsiella pneumoniae]